MILLAANNCLQDGWSMTHIIRIGEEWQANISNDEHVAVGTGETIEDALITAMDNAHNDKFVGRLFHLAPLKAVEEQAKGRSLLAQLGLAKPKPTIVRRF